MTRPTLKPATLILTLLLPIGPGHAIAAAEAAIPVSPGDWQTGAPLADTCPSFSWGAVDGAQRYELAIFDAQWQDSPAYDDQLSFGAQLRQIEIAAPALSWTAAGADCLEAGGTYLWFVRAQTADGDGPWSAPRYFAIDYEADALTQTVRRELAAQLRQPQVWRDVIQAAHASNAHLRLTPLAPGVVAPAGAADGTGLAGAGSALWEASAESMATVLVTSFPNPAALKVNSPNGVVFNQSATGGGIPAEGGGTRFMWYPGKAALRAGAVSDNQWDYSNVGWWSTAMGYNTIARELGSTAMGYGATASNLEATAMGFNTTASGEGSTAMGWSTNASGHSSTAMGYFSIASSSGATAIGYSAVASSPGSTAMGNSTNASGTGSTAMGQSTVAQSFAETAIGSYNTLADSFDPVSWKRSDRLFVIGNGVSDAAPSGALTLLKTGDLTIAGQAYKPGGGSWEASSDLRLKAVLGEYDIGLAEIAALKPVRYHYAIGNARGHDPAPEYVGFIAQQVQEVLPEAVSQAADGYLNLDMHAIHVAMVNAIRTLRELNRIQQELIVDLHAQNAELEQRLASLEEEQRRSTSLHAQMVSLQAQMQVLQGQVMRATGIGQVAVGR